MDEQKQVRSGSKPQLSMSIPKPLINMVKDGMQALLTELKDYNVESASHLFRLMVLQSKIVDGSLVIDLSKAQDVK